MERPSSRAGMHPEKERRSQMNGGSTSKHKSKSPHKNSSPNWLNNNNSIKSPYLDRSLSYNDSYMGPHTSYSTMMSFDPLAHSRGIPQPYVPNFQSCSLYPEPGYHGGVSAEPASLPVYPLSAWSIPKTRSRPWVPAPAWDVWSSAYAPTSQSTSHLRDLNMAAANHGLSSQEEEDFASLPPIFNDLKTSKAGQRRFSDPGIVAPPTQGSGSSSSSSAEEDSVGDAAAQSGIIQRLLLEMSALRETNQRLFRELEETRSQFESMRVQQSSWRRLGPEYQPGMVAEMVREVREASRIREEAMMSRLKLATGGLPDLNEGVRSPLDVQGLHRSERRRSEPLRYQNHQASQQQIRGDERRRRKRHQDHSRHSQQGSIRGDGDSTQDDESSVSGMSGSVSTPAAAAHTGMLADQVSQLRREKQQLSGELRQAVDSRTEAEAHAQKLERLVGILRKKITAMNGLEQHTGTEMSGPVSLASVPESLSSASSESSLDHNTAAVTPMPQVLIHGPVTNL